MDGGGPARTRSGHPARWERHLNLLLASAGPAIAPAVIAAIAGLGGALIGGLATYLTTSKLGKHQRVLAVDERTQQRRGDTYVDTMRYLNWAALYAAEVRMAQTATFDPPREIPVAPEDGYGLAGRVLSYGSAAVVTGLRQLIRAIDAFDSAVRTIEATKGQGVPLDYTGLDTARDDVIRQADGLRNQMRSELGVDALPAGF